MQVPRPSSPEKRLNVKIPVFSFLCLFGFCFFFLASSEDNALKIDRSVFQVLYCLLDFTPRESNCWSQVSALKGA